MLEDLDWLLVIIGLCKVFEIEVIIKIFYLFLKCFFEINLFIDKFDKDLGRIVKFLLGEGKVFEMGIFVYFF